MKLAMLLIMLQLPAASGPVTIDLEKADEGGIVEYFDTVFGAPRVVNEILPHDGEPPSRKQTRIYRHLANDKAWFFRNLKIVRYMSGFGKFRGYESLPILSISFDLWVPRRTTVEDLERIVFGVLGEKPKDAITNNSRLAKRLETWQSQSREPDAGIRWVKPDTKIQDLATRPNDVAIEPGRIETPPLSELKQMRQVGVLTRYGLRVEDGQKAGQLHPHPKAKLGSTTVDYVVYLYAKQKEVPDDRVLVHVKLDGI